MLWRVPIQRRPKLFGRARNVRVLLTAVEIDFSDEQRDPLGIGLIYDVG